MSTGRKAPTSRVLKNLSGVPVGLDKARLRLAITEPILPRAKPHSKYCYRLDI